LNETTIEQQVVGISKGAKNERGANVQPRSERGNTIYLGKVKKSGRGKKKRRANKKKKRGSFFGSHC